MEKLEHLSIEEQSIATIRTLAMDAVQKAESGHPGTPMALAPLAYVLWTEHMRYHPKSPDWLNRDRFVLSNGHASMLLYAMLYLTGYDLSLNDLKSFRQLGSKTPGHPEYGLTPGVETTTGPLGQGIMNAAGMAMAEAHLAARFNRDDFSIIDHDTYAICSDGDLMEGASHEAASLAGHFGLHKLICIYDDNHISIEGQTNLTFSSDIAERFRGYHWHVQEIGEAANDLAALSNALDRAKNETEQPSLIIVRSHIAYGAPTMQDTPEAHGSPLGEDEIRETKRLYGWPEDAQFLVPEAVVRHMRQAIDRGAKLEKEWSDKLEEYRQAHPKLAEELEMMRKGSLPRDWDRNIPHFEPADGPVATRSASGKVQNAFVDEVPWLIGGSADLAPSTKTLMKESDYFGKGNYANRNIAWGVREHAMCAASSGIALHGGLRPYASTFLIFSDYARPAIRLAALMKLPVIYVMTHDSIGLGEDGPTHQPVEHLASLRAIPNLTVIRPADANEVGFAWRVAMQRKEGPVMLVLTRQKLPIFDRRQVASAENLYKGAYIISKEKGEKPDLLLMASGSEVQLTLSAQDALANDGIDARVISMPSWELFREQPPNYRDDILPSEVKARLAVEAASPFGWREWIGETGEMIGVESFGASAPYQELMKSYGLNIENILAKAKSLV